MRSSVLAAGLIAAGGLILAAACGGSENEAAGVRPSQSADRQAFADCLRKQGVEMPQGGRPTGRPESGRPTGRPESMSPERQKAMDACRSLAPNRSSSEYQAFRGCMKDHGVTVAERPGKLKTSDPKVAKALKTCKPLMPSGRPNGDGNG